MQTLDKILEKVALATGISLKEITGPARREKIAVARSMYYYVARIEGHKTSETGEAVGRKYATVSIQSRKFSDWLETGDGLSRAYYESYMKTK
jgi:chromosomal replication initiation ATPase DnaA